MQHRSMVTPLSPVQVQKDRYFPPHTHPYRLLERTIDDSVSSQSTVLDIGCGRTAPTLRRLKGKARALYGVDLVDFTQQDEGLSLFNADVCRMPFLDDESVDLAYSRSVMEHVEDAEAAYREIHRVLKPGGRYVFLTPNKWDYVAVMAMIIPNSLHPRIVRLVSGRAEEDTFPTYYRSNTKSDISKLANDSGFQVDQLDYLNQYPAYLKFSRPLFWIGSQYERLLSRLNVLAGLRGWIFCVLRKPEK